MDNELWIKGDGYSAMGFGQGIIRRRLKKAEKSLCFNRVFKFSARRSTLVPDKI